MNRSIRLAGGLVVVGLLTFVLGGCEGDRGPAGPAGTTECFGCHTDDFTMTNFLLPFQQDFAVSQHRLGDTFLRRGAPCSRCHTNEGFQEFITTGVEADQFTSSQIQCFTCHEPHTNFDFSMRQMGPVEFAVEGVFSGSELFDKGNSNTCAICHQARPANPPIADGAVVTSTRWGPHHGPQANMLSGNGAWAFPGATYRVGPSHDLILNGCITCHMGPAPSSAAGGGHTFNVSYDSRGSKVINGQACIDCHDGWIDDNGLATTETEAAQALFKADLDLVQAELFARGFISTADPATIPKTTTGTYANADDLGAIFNLLVLLEDRSLGVHNPVYQGDVLAATKAYLGLP